MKRSEFLKKLIGGGVAAALPAVAAVAAAPGPASTNVSVPGHITVPVPVTMKEIRLCSPLVAGLRYYDGEANVDELRPGDALNLVREPKNTHDRYAIEVFKGPLKLGYIPRTDNKVVARMMDQNVDVFASIRFVNPEEDSYNMVRIRVYYLSSVKEV